MTSEPGWKTELEDGLVMRGATRDDAMRLADFNTEMHTDDDEPREWMWNWTNDLVTKPHPTMKLDDIILVEDTSNGQVVSSCIYFEQTWSYCGIPVPFGRPELVSTHPDYRNRGLIRRQFEQMHRWGDERGHLVLGITGIPFYYRQFGYEMALPMGPQRDGSVAHLPKPKKDEKLPVSIRPAERSDAPFITNLKNDSLDRSLFAPLVTPDEVEYQIFDRHPKSVISRKALIIEDESAQAVGFAVYSPAVEMQGAELSSLEFNEMWMFREYTEPFLKLLRDVLLAVPAEGDKSVRVISARLADGHPAQSFLGSQFPSGKSNYAWYMRTPDLPKLLKLVAPKLEERLAGTVFGGLSGEKVLSFYRSGVAFTFEDGNITDVKETKFPVRHKAVASLPDLSFLQLLFGRTNMSGLREVLVDAHATSSGNELLLDTLFPKMPSDTRFAMS